MRRHATNINVGLRWVREGVPRSQILARGRATQDTREGAMSGTYLITSYHDKDQVKAFGARWDPARKQWYVPPGRDVEPFSAWLPQGTTVPVPDAPMTLNKAPLHASTDLALRRMGIPLSQLLSGVAHAVADAFAEGVWTLVEVVDTRIRNGHVYLEVSERDVHGVIAAKATAVIWASQAGRILPGFQQATGVELGAGIKLMVHARPVFKAQYGFSLEIDGIDADYTLGDLEARKREIRERLQREGLFELNRLLPSPWDYRHVLVIAPEGGAGLGDFRAEASRLDDNGVCKFIYAYSRFQGEGAAAEIQLTLRSALTQIRLNHPWLPDAVVIIRGGGAVNDMAWLNDYALVRYICELEIPVLTGIGHERDGTVLDEVANLRFDTPSKVIGGIEQTIVNRAREAKGLFDHIAQTGLRQIEHTRRNMASTFLALESSARHELTRARQESTELLSEMKLDAIYSVRTASETSQRQINETYYLAQQQLSMAKREVPALMVEINSEARQALRTATVQSDSEWRFISERAIADLRRQRDAVNRVMGDTAIMAKKSPVEARDRSQALMREIAGQGPEKTLRRGFTLVRNAAGHAVTSSLATDTDIFIQFRDGQRAAKLKEPYP